MPSPTIDLEGRNPLLIVAGMPYQDPGVKAKDENGNSLTPTVDWGGLDLADPQPGVYVIGYEVRDALDRINVAQRRIEVIPAPQPEDPPATRERSGGRRLQWEHANQAAIGLVLILMIGLLGIAGLATFRHLWAVSSPPGPVTIGGGIELGASVTALAKSLLESGIRFESDGAIRVSVGKPEGMFSKSDPAVLPHPATAPAALAVEKVEMTVNNMEVFYHQPGYWRAELVPDENLLLQQLIKRESGKPLAKGQSFLIGGRRFCWNGSTWLIWNCDPDE